MSANTFGDIFRVTTFGESHGFGVGVVVDGCPAGLEISEDEIQVELDRRKPGQSKITTDRKESDTVKIFSGVFEGKTTGTPIMMMVGNNDQRSQDYDKMKDLFRPSHADYTYSKKYSVRDYRGGGRSSARIMIGRVAAGAIAKKFLQEKLGVECLAFTSQVGEVKFDPNNLYGIELKSERLDFKPISFKYLEEIDRGFTDNVARYINLKQKGNQNIGETAKFVSGVISKNQIGEQITFAVLKKDTQEFVGVCALDDLKVGCLTFGLWIKESLWGQGYGKEMISRLKSFAEENYPITRLKYQVFEGNTASVGIVESLGGVETDRAVEGVFEVDGTEAVGINYDIPFESKYQNFYDKVSLGQVESNIVRCPDTKAADKMIDLIQKTKEEKDSLGGVVTGVVRGVPVGLGEPEFDKLPALLAKAMMSINATKGFEIGSGFSGVKMKGSEHNDSFYTDELGKVRTMTNNAGGVLGGISSGENIYFKVAIKPVATIGQIQKTVDQNGDNTEVEGKGRHDPCVLPRAVPIIEAMSALVIMDLYLRNLKNQR